MVLLRLAAFFLVIALLIWFFSAPRRQRSHPGRAGKPAGAIPLQRDPVCGLFIPGSQAVTLSHRGETIYFCSSACRDQFIAKNRS